MRYLLDTNTCVFFLRGKLNLAAIIQEKGRENCCLSEITIVELRYGAENSDIPDVSHKAVDNFVSGLAVLPIFGCIRRYARKRHVCAGSESQCTMNLIYLLGLLQLSTN